MFKWLGSLVDSNEKELKKLQPLVSRVNGLEADLQTLSDAGLGAKTSEFKKRLAEATSELRGQIEEARTSLEEARKGLANAQEPAEKEELATHVPRLEERLKELDGELQKGEKEALNDLLPEAFAVVREAARRTIRQRHFDVQLMGGMVLHQGRIAEMKTGEGKTLVATLPLYLNALTGRGCHLATVNDYLARRDPYWMGPIYHLLGLRVASIYPQQDPSEYAPARLYDPDYDSGDPRWKQYRPITRQEAYQADITYGTSSEFGFDYLRDNMVVDLAQCVQRPLNYAIVDEVDNLLIDEARTPLIISGAGGDAGQMYKAVNDVVSRLKMKVQPHEPVAPEEKEQDEALEEQYDYIAYEKSRNVRETPRGQERLARAFGLKAEELFGGEGGDQKLTLEEARKRSAILSIFRKSMSAHALYQRDRDYVVTDKGEVVIVDEFTGRLMVGRRYAEGLHQAIEAKERVKVQQETRTYATVTIQNYFRMYHKLGGMTGTAATEAEEFHKIYKLDVVVIPTHKPMIREDFSDVVYKDENAKFKAVVKEIEELHQVGQPVLVGTVSIEKSERLSDLMKRQGIPHEVLNAKKHEREASIIAQAGRPGAVTVATNMAGRGVDIILGGNPEGRDPREWQEEHNKVVSLGGLHVLGTERHEARRIDNQLRGRSGRQGDPGSSRFYVSLEDDVMRRFGGDRVKSFMEWAGMDESTAIENPLINKSIENAQVRVEGYHFDMRKHLVDFDDVVNKQRELIYGERRKILSGTDLRANILSMVREEIGMIADSHLAHETEPDHQGLVREAGAILPLPPSLTAQSLAELSRTEIEGRLEELAETLYQEKEKELGAENMRTVERVLMLRIIDSLWVEHLTNMEYMREGIGLQAVAQRDPLVAYKREGHNLFEELLSTIRHDVVHTIYHIAIAKQEAPQKQPVGARPVGAPQPQRTPAGTSQEPPRPLPKSSHKVGRNEPCPCGSGKKYKHCCGR